MQESTNASLSFEIGGRIEDVGVVPYGVTTFGYGRLNTGWSIETDEPGARVEAIGVYYDDGFKNPTAENPMLASEFLGYLDLSPVMDLLEAKYGNSGHFRYPIEAMIKALVLRRLVKLRHFTKLERHLLTHEQDARNLGFRPSAKGGRVVPDQKTFRHFENVRLDVYGMRQLYDALLWALKEEVAKWGRSFGHRVACDATPIEALNNDKECHYNPHYEIRGWKIHTLLDIEYNIPLAFEVTDVVEADIPFLLPLLAKADELNFEFTDVYADGAYASAETFGVIHSRYMANAWFNLRKDYKKHPEAEEEGIKAAYQKHWNRYDFKPGASLEEMLEYLVAHRDSEIVGKYWRNRYIEKWEEMPIQTKLEYGKRSRIEGFHGHIKEHLNIEKYLDYKGVRCVERHTLMTYIALLAVALCRAQHGVFEGMVDVETLC